MNKYIDRDKLAEFARHSTIGIDANDIMRFPTADVVEVVRCKDCIHRRKFNKTKYYCEKTYADLSGWHKRVDDDFFCADGERKEIE